MRDLPIVLNLYKPGSSPVSFLPDRVEAREAPVSLKELDDQNEEKVVVFRATKRFERTFVKIADREFQAFRITAKSALTEIARQDLCQSTEGSTLRRR